MVVPLRMPSRVERAYAISQAGYKTFPLRSDAVYMDRLSANS